MTFLKKNFLSAMAVLGHLPKLKKGLGLATVTFFNGLTYKNTEHPEEQERGTIAAVR